MTASLPLLISLGDTHLGLSAITREPKRRDSDHQTQRSER
jgi:hypothetical protein